jgi:hypothetical protein
MKKKNPRLENMEEHKPEHKKDSSEPEIIEA